MASSTSTFLRTREYIHAPGGPQVSSTVRNPNWMNLSVEVCSDSPFSIGTYIRLIEESLLKLTLSQHIKKITNSSPVLSQHRLIFKLYITNPAPDSHPTDFPSYQIAGNMDPCLNTENPGALNQKVQNQLKYYSLPPADCTRGSSSGARWRSPLPSTSERLLRRSDRMNPRDAESPSAQIT